jgi:GrpB-like predicted nucleotidyltransferase (UPF0157 family)
MRKIKVLPYNSKFPSRFQKEKRRIFRATSANDIHHIGSTAVPGLGGKGIIDIMIGIKDWKEAKGIVKKLKKIDFRHVHPKEKGRLFLSKHHEHTPNSTNIDIVRKGTKQYKELLFFRDYLRKHKKEIKKLFKLKLKWLKEAEGNRERYFKLKEKYIRDILKKCK